MARRGESFERRIAREVVNSVLNNGRNRDKKQNGVRLFICVLFIIGAVFSSFSLKDNSSETSEEYNSDRIEAVDSTQESRFDSGGYSDLDYYESKPSIPNGERVKIERCVDGDTLIVITSTGERQRVRLIGSNTPETVKKNSPVEPYGPEASAYTKQRVAETGNIATLVSDGDAFDRYNRRLAFVYLGNETVSLNEDLCRQGLARAETKYRYSKEMKTRLTQAADLARSEGLGIYSL